MPKKIKITYQRGGRMEKIAVKVQRPKWQQYLQY